MGGSENRADVRSPESRDMIHDRCKLVYRGQKASLRPFLLRAVFR